mmetsp:Transcript_8857/g.8934  ORF Transcript_8857/g.8934 Transcript_8857/m.8934 type:complete len:389 (+) Transcript_8857:260-1426(+)
MSFARLFCSFISQSGKGHDEKSEATTTSDITTTSSGRFPTSTPSGKFASLASGKFVPKLNVREEFRKSRGVNSTFMRNYTLLENISATSVNEAILSRNNVDSPKFPITYFSVHTHRGFAAANPDKKNQDAIATIQHNESKSLVIACMDGHGMFGEIVSQYVTKRLEESLCDHTNFTTNLHGAITDTITSIEQEVFATPSIDCETSGTTLTMAVIRGNTVTVANVGDSRVVIIRKEKNGVKVLPLTYDHTPELEEERDRILSAGGRVFGVKYPDGTTGPNRIWLAQYDAPGLAMSRSVGDRLVHGVGVISTPTFMEHVIDEDDVAIVVASDGLWNVLSDEEVVKHVMSSRDSSGAVGLLLREARIRWLTSGAGTTADDTTVAVAFFHGR